MPKRVAEKPWRTVGGFKYGEAGRRKSLTTQFSLRRAVIATFDFCLMEAALISFSRKS